MSLLAEGREHTENKSKDERMGLHLKRPEGEGWHPALRHIQCHLSLFADISSGLSYLHTLKRRCLVPFHPTLQRG